MRPVGRPAADSKPESIEFVPKRDLDRAQQENERLRKEIERLKQEAERLRRELEAALRASKRQAAPHSRGTPKANPRRPGRKPGRRYGRQACRPTPSRVDEQIAVPLPERCPHCGGGVEPESCQPQYQEEIVRRKVGGRLQWLHVAVSAQVTVYAILPGRGYPQSVVILGAEYDGFLLHDGWAPYYRFQFAFHQSCWAHLLNRCREMAQIASPSALAFPRAVEHLLQTSLELRDRYEQGEVSERGMRIATGKLETKLDRMLEKRRRNPANHRLARHLEHEQLWLFTFLHCFGLDATNNAAERAIRGMVISRKVWGGNRTWEGARTQQILARVRRTCGQQGKDAFTRCVSLLRAPRMVILDIVPGAD